MRETVKRTTPVPKPPRLSDAGREYLAGTGRRLGEATGLACLVVGNLRMAVDKQLPEADRELVTPLTDEIAEVANALCRLRDALNSLLAKGSDQKQGSGGKRR